MTKVLFFLFGGVGGVERMTINIAKMLPRGEYDVKFVVCGRLEDIFHFIPAGYEVIRIPWLNIHVFSRIRIARVICREKPDFVFSSTMGLNVRLIQSARWCKVRCIVRNDNNLCYVDEKMHRRIARQYPYAYKVIAQQEEMRQDIINLVGTDDKHVIALQNPLDKDVIDEKLSAGGNPYPQDGSVNYVWIANFNPVKGHDTLIEAFKLVRRQNPSAHLYLVGKTEGDDFCRVKSLADNSGIGDFIHFPGFQSNPYVWMKYADCFVLPSRMEGLPNVLIESMYCGIPVVAARCIPVIDRIVEDGYNGYKVPVDDPASMAEAMIGALNLKDCRMTYRGASKEDFIRLFKL